ncbi:DUF1758 domain-containing protein [Trichonephila clavipes]|nr:DUF1758 domain-containing protein [Trichonephila clavipes]
MSEDLSKFKKNCTAVRSSLTKLINKIEGKINNENEPVNQFEAFLDQLNDKESNLNLLNTLIEDRLSVDTITEDMEASEEIKEKIIFWKTKLSSKIRRINSDSIQVDTGSRNIQVINSNSFECMNINLPKLHINKYSGNYSEWDDPNLCIEIEAVETEHISVTNLPTPDRNIDKKFRYLKNVQLADPYEFNDKEISILIGADYYYQVVTGRITRLNKNLVTVETLFGWSLQGQSTDSEDILTMSVIVNESNISKQLCEFWDLENLGIEAEVSDEENIDNDIMSEFEAGIFHTKICGIKLNSLGNLT